MSGVEIFRPKSGFVFAGVAFWMVSIMIYLQIIDYGFNLGLIISILWGTLICSICYQIFIYPKIVFFDEGVEIFNPFSRHLIGWQDVEQIDARYTMSIKTSAAGGGYRQIYAFAAPAPGRYHSRNIHRSELRGLNIQSSESIQTGQSPRSHSGVASAIANQKLVGFRKLNQPKLVQYQYVSNKIALWMNSTLLVTSILFTVIHS